MKKGRHQEFSFRDGPRSYEFGRHERHDHYYGARGGGGRWRCPGCGKTRYPISGDITVYSVATTAYSRNRPDAVTYT